MLKKQIFEIWRISNSKNLKADVHPICPFVFILAHRHYSVLRVDNIVYVILRLPTPPS